MVPLDKNGKPMVKVSNGAKETIPTVQYANITIGPAWVEKWVEDTPEAIETGLRECLEAAEKVLGENRDMIHNNAKQAGIK